MRVAQFKILTKILNNIDIPRYITAFEKNRSIPDMATLHVNKEVVVSVDIKDFFHSIKQSHIYDFFTGMGIDEMPSRTLSEICTYKSFLPQGALTSPKLANIITALTFGPTLKEYCDTNGLTLTIYADDVTISSTNPATNVSEILSFVTSTIRVNSFRVNHAKTKVMWKTSRQYVCGVVVNNKTNMIKKERYKLRAIVHNITKNGVESEALKNQSEISHFIHHIRGRINWLKQLNNPMGEKYANQLTQYLDTVKEAQGDVPVVTKPSTIASANPSSNRDVGTMAVEAVF